jgi:hypothetical protein
MTVGDPAGLDRDERWIDRAHSLDGVEGGVNGDEREGPVEEQDVDERPRAGSVPQSPAGPAPEPFVGLRERTRRARPLEGDRAREGAGLAGEEREVVVEQQDSTFDNFFSLASMAFADQPSVRLKWVGVGPVQAITRPPGGAKSGCHTQTMHVRSGGRLVTVQYGKDHEWQLARGFSR